MGTVSLAEKKLEKKSKMKNEKSGNKEREGGYLKQAIVRTSHIGNLHSSTRVHTAKKDRHSSRSACDDHLRSDTNEQNITQTRPPEPHLLIQKIMINVGHFSEHFHPNVILA